MLEDNTKDKKKSADIPRVSEKSNPTEKASPIIEEPLTENPIELKRNQARKAKEEREAERLKNTYT
jgi:hypothetical protein